MTSEGKGHRKFWTAAASAMIAALPGLACAQEAGGVSATLTFSQGLTYSDTDGTFGRTNLGYSVNSVTRSQTLGFNLSGALEQDFDGGLSMQVVNPRVGLSYGIESRQTSMNASLGYRASDVDGFVEDPDGEPEDLILDDGTREDINANLGLTFGREMRFGGSVNLGFRETAYSDTTSADLIDTDRTNVGVNLRFEIDRRITANLGYQWAQTDRATGRDVLNEDLTAGATLEVTQTLKADVSVGLNQITVTDGGIDTVTDGLSYDINLTQSRPNGALRFSLRSNVSESGRRTAAIVGGTFETQRGEFMADVGVSEGADNQIRPLVTLRYSEDLPRGNYSIDLRQRFSTDADGDETLNSRLRFNWRQNLTQSSNLASSVTYQMTDVLGADEDAARLELGLTYSHDLNEDWALKTSYTHSFVDQDGVDSSRENEIFVGLETALGWRP